MVRFWSEEEIASGKYGCYQDVQSLYPTVQYYDAMPVGHPRITVYVDKESGMEYFPQPSVEELSCKFGFIRCDIRPTRYLHHPVLVEKKQGKLMADLYPKSEYVCSSVELKVALENGYVVDKVYEIHEYAQSSMLFRDYVKTFLKIKIEAGGMPKWIKTDEDWKLFYNEHHERLDIQLDKAKMIKNPGKKQVYILLYVQSLTFTDGKTNVEFSLGQIRPAC